MKQDIKSMNLSELEAALGAMGEKKFRAGQVFSWLQKGVESFDEMTNLSKELRGKLEQEFDLTPPQVVPEAGEPAGRHHEISLAASGRQLCGDGTDAV